MPTKIETINNLTAGWYVSVGAIGAIILVLCIGLAIFEANLTKCSNCEHDVFALKYCHDCGAALSSVAYCSNCREECDTPYCPHCGEKNEEETK